MRPSKPAGRSPTCEVHRDAGAVLPEDVESLLDPPRLAAERDAVPGVGRLRLPPHLGRPKRATPGREDGLVALGGANDSPQLAEIGGRGVVGELRSVRRPPGAGDRVMGEDVELRLLRARGRLQPLAVTKAEHVAPEANRRQRLVASGDAVRRRAGGDHLGRRRARLDPVVERVQKLPVAGRAGRVAVLELRRAGGGRGSARPRAGSS